MKAVLISIKPQFCELIASGKKAIEVRKTKPKLKTPFKCYIYETKAINHQKILVDLDGNLPTTYAKGSGKVIGEFVCNKITTIFYGCEIMYGIDYPNKHAKQLEDDSCLSLKELKHYANAKDVYGWHISDLKIYDTPKELSEFRKPGGRQCVSDNGRFCKYIQASPGDDPADANTMSCIYGEQNCPFEHLSRPPQSWGYVEEIE